VGFFFVATMFITYEKHLLLIRFYERSFGSTFAADNIVTHYSIREMDLGKRLREANHRYILFSDPITTNNIKAFTGFNAVFSNPNIDDMSSDLREYLRAQMKYLLTSDAFSPDVFFTDYMNLHYGKY